MVCQEILAEIDRTSVHKEDSLEIVSDNCQKILAEIDRSPEHKEDNVEFVSDDEDILKQ